MRTPDDPAVGGGFDFDRELRDTFDALVDPGVATDDRWDEIRQDGMARARPHNKRRAVQAATVAFAAVVAAFLVVRLSTTESPEAVDMSTRPQVEGPSSADLSATPVDSWARLLGKVPGTSMSSGARIFVRDLSRSRSQAGVDPITGPATAEQKS